MVKLARFLAEVRTRTRTQIPEDVDPVWLIMSHLAANEHTVEAKALRKSTLAVIATDGDMADSDLWALGKDALGLLDAFALRKLAGRYTELELAIFSERLGGGAP